MVQLSQNFELDVDIHDEVTRLFSKEIHKELRRNVGMIWPEDTGLSVRFFNTGIRRKGVIGIYNMLRYAVFVNNKRTITNSNLRNPNLHAIQKLINKHINRMSAAVSRKFNRGG